MNLIELLNGDDKNSPFDDYVPVIQSKDGRTTDIYLTDTITYPSEYNKTCYVLDNAVHGDIVTMHINNGGGHIDSAFQIINSMKNSKAHIIGKLSGTVASASTVIALHCHAFDVADYTAFMIHNYSGGVMGKGHEIKAQQDFVDKELNSAFRTIYSGFLTEKEMAQVINGRDIWIGKSEVLFRWSNRFSSGSTPVVEDLSAEFQTRPKRRGRPSRKVD